MHNDLAATATADPRVPITIFLATRSFGDSRLYHPDLDFVEAYTYHYLPSSGPASDEQTLEAQFEIFNDQTDSLHAALYYAAGNRSLSVGDAVRIHDRYYLCASIGWTPIDPIPTSDSGPAARDATKHPRRCIPLTLTAPYLGAVTVLADADDRGHSDMEALRSNLVRIIVTR